MDWDKVGSTYYHQVEIGGVPAPLLDNELLDYLADAMGYLRTERASRILDVEASIHSTVEQGGIPQFIYKKQHQQRCLLIMEDAVALATKWNHIAAELVAGMEVSTPSFADKLRRFLGTEFSLQPPACVMGRIYCLPDTREAAAGISFSWTVLKILRQGFRIYWQPDEQEKIIAFILKEVDLIRSVRTKNGKPSLTELKWQALWARIELETAPDSALPKL